MEPWIRKGLLEFLKLIFVISGTLICYMIIIAICKDIGIHPAWGYVTVFVAGALAVTLGSEKAKHDLERARVKIRNKKEKK